MLAVTERTMRRTAMKMMRWWQVAREALHLKGRKRKRRGRKTRKRRRQCSLIKHLRRIRDLARSSTKGVGSNRRITMIST